MNRQAYPSDLSDDEWELVKPLIPVHQGVGHHQNSDFSPKEGSGHFMCLINHH
jgi:transposase